MKHKSLAVILGATIALSLSVQPGLSVGPYYEEYFTDGTTDIEWESAWVDSLGNPLTPMQVQFVAGNPSGDGWVGVVESDTAILGGLGLAIAGDHDLNDYIIEAQIYVDITASSFYEGIMMRVNVDTTTDIIEGYQLVSSFYPPWGLSRLKFRRYSTIPDNIRDLRVYSNSEIPGGAPTESGWHKFGIKAIGNQFWVYWDDQELPDNPQTDTTVTPLSNGEFGPYVFNMEAFTQVMCDDIVVGPSGITLNDPSPGLAGQVNTFSVTDATPGNNVFFVYGFQPGSTPVPGCSGTTLDIANLTMNNMFGFDAADQDGNASVSAYVPAPASGILVRFQAVELSNCIVSNRVDYTFP
jgi:hypothetical protein